MIVSEGNHMSKLTIQQENSDEKKVLQELQGYAKESIDKIAKRCGFSRQKVWRIIKKLESNQTIWGYHAVVNNQQLHLKIHKRNAGRIQFRNLVAITSVSFVGYN